MHLAVFPAPAGMNRGATQQQRLHRGVPRASGDEPSLERQIEALKACSPRQRG